MGDRDGGRENEQLTIPKAVALAIYGVTSIATVTLLVLHTLRVGGVTVDTTTLGLLAVLLIVPVAPYITSISAGPFSAKIGEREASKLRLAAADLPSVGAPRLAFVGTAVGTVVPPTEPTIEELMSRDPALGLAKLRLELEKELRRLYYGGREPSDLVRAPSIGQMTRELRKRQVLPPEVANPLDDVVGLANRAVHGATIAAEPAQEIGDVGIRVLDFVRCIPTPERT